MPNPQCTPPSPLPHSNSAAQKVENALKRKLTVQIPKEEGEEEEGRWKEEKGEGREKEEGGEGEEEQKGKKKERETGYGGVG